VIALGGLYDTANAYSAPKNNHHGMMINQTLFESTAGTRCEFRTFRQDRNNVYHGVGV